LRFVSSPAASFVVDLLRLIMASTIRAFAEMSLRSKVCCTLDFLVDLTRWWSAIVRVFINACLIFCEEAEAKPLHSGRRQRAQKQPAAGVPP
jgi:hypothetical protein